MTDHELTQRITDYLTGGGFFNPEMANHEAVRDLLIDCRDALAQPEHRIDTPESHIVRWSIPVDPDNFGEPLAQPEEPVCDKDPSLCGFTLCQLAKVCKHTPRNTMPTKIFAPNLEQILNAAGFYRREWVGLTGCEIELVLINSGYTAENFARVIEAKLKEKNHG